MVKLLKFSLAVYQHVAISQIKVRMLRLIARSLRLKATSYVWVVIHGVPVDRLIVEEGGHLDVKTAFLSLLWLKPELPTRLKRNPTILDGFLHQLLPFGRCR